MKMSAMICKEYGPKSFFGEAKIDIPNCPKDHLLIRVMATSLNPIDNKILRLGLAIAPELPSILHGDVAGIVDKVGDDVQEFSVGDEVFGLGGGVKGTHGALSEFMLVHKDTVIKKPKNLNFYEAAALPLVSITAYQALYEKKKIRENDRLLIWGGTGGVAHIALQMAKVEGTRIFVTYSNEKKKKILEKYKPDGFFNYVKEDPKEFLENTTNGEGFNLVFDSIGGENLKRSYQFVKDEGHLITTNSRVEMDLTPLHGKGLSLDIIFMLLPLIKKKNRLYYKNVLNFICYLVNENMLSPLIDDEIFDIRDINHAHKKFESNKHVGKIVIKGFDN